MPDRHPLDRPIWSALTSQHATFASGTGRAKIYPGDVSPFLAACDDSEKSLSDLIGLLPENDHAILLQREPSPLPAKRAAVAEVGGVQMVAEDLKPAPLSDRVLELSDKDVLEMVALATTTRPGPFLRNTHRLGGFIGIREEGKLVAMAGERLHLDSWCEVSAVCTHPDYRGRGYAGLLTSVVANRIAERGETPFLHTYAVNAGAIRLYESLGFRHRCDMTVQVVKRA